ncbi:hypothetical protein EJ02DRAFT_420058 [Clathrospora elynae]|uniref:Uncharacterized protein n=1 Tax=Clathrospora elynae TaxID=706981 RepID=A0A6A5T6P2_9PLEO|nr:hypothetical protein EJ02DRAFT_420058 [Clathrospora elynae]
MMFKVALTLATSIILTVALAVPTGGAALPQAQQLGSALQYDASAAIPNPPWTSDQSVSVLASPPILLTAVPSPVSGYTSGGETYAPGFCSFHLQLFNQCLHTPSEGWHSQMLAMLYSMQDNNRKTVVAYPEGAGRIDNRAMGLMGMGNFKLAYNGADEQMYFSYDKPGGWWSTATKDDGHAFGLCSWGAWTRGSGVCDDKATVMPRLSDMTCVFKC